MPELHKKAYITAGVLSIAGCFLMVAFPEIAIQGVGEGMDLFVESVLPALFPFCIAVNFMGKVGVPARVGRIFEPVFRRLFHCGGLGAFVWISSLFSGYPMGAKLIGELCRDGAISSKEGKRMLSYSCVCGPLFMVGTLGTVMEGDPLCGYFLALGHYFSAWINGMIYCRIGSNRFSEKGGKPISRKEGTPVFTMLSDSIGDALTTMGTVFGYIVLFSLISQFLHCSWFFQNHPGQQALVTGLLEMTSGCSRVSELTHISRPLRLGCYALLLGFGGCCVAGQSLSLLSGSGIGAGTYLKMKLWHGVTAGMMTTGIAALWDAVGKPSQLAGLVYGTEHEVIRALGGIHSSIYRAGSLVVIIVFMALLCVMDSMISMASEKINHKLHCKKERESEEP